MLLRGDSLKALTISSLASSASSYKAHCLTCLARNALSISQPAIIVHRVCLVDRIGSELLEFIVLGVVVILPVLLGRLAFRSLRGRGGFLHFDSSKSGVWT